MIVICINNIRKRNTIQSKKIVEALSAIDHASAEDIYTRVAMDISGLSLATVYRNLKRLSQEGTIISVIVNGEARYELKRSSHVDFVCRSCGRIDEFFLGVATENNIVKLPTGYQMDEIQILAKGLCPICKRGEVNDKGRVVSQGEV